MIYPVTERQDRFMKIARELAAKFSERAAAHDRDGSFPHENFDDIRAAGLPALVIPKRFGGWEASLLETVLTIGEMAVGDGSTALNFTMHAQVMGGAEAAQNWPVPLYEKVCRAAVERGALINAIASEPAMGSPSRGGKPKTTATPVYADGDTEKSTPSGWIINGRKNFASMSPTLDFMIVLAAREDGSDETARFLVEPNDKVEIVETWDTMGMRATGSHDVIFHDVFVPHSHMINPTPKGEAKLPANPGFSLNVGAVYLGIAQAALNAALHFARERVPTALGKPIAEVESVQRRLGEAELLLHQSRMHIYHAADLWDRFPDRRAALDESNVVAKYIATNNAIEIVDKAMRVVGGVGMSRKFPLERYYRDVRGGLSHPMSDDVALVKLGNIALDRYAQADGA
ncbi:MAG: acyl-CoA dehydrogenase family protein [Litorilinea sp.]